MADFSQQRTALVKQLIAEGIIKSDKVKNALMRVPREEFVPSNYREWAYVDSPLPIGHGQTISAPHMVALMTELLDPEPGDIVLEVGTGSGYQAAVLAEIVAKNASLKKGHVYTIERIPELAEFARENLRRTKYIDYVTVVVGDGTKGYLDAAPYDKIIVTAAAPSIPQPLIEQLKPGGRVVIPVGDMYYQRLLVVSKRIDGSLDVRKDTWCVFVPLIGEYGWKIQY
ncbi:MAG: protein-L-isoaspartate O-methyltransferase [Desulfurococcaceae archaeon]